MEHDTMGQVAVPADKLWGAQTQRSFENFPIGEEKMPADLITAFGVLKEACAAANHKLGKLDDTRYALIQSACQAIRAGELAEHFPLAVWQTGSGTQTNMNCNEVIARYGNNKAGEALLHPNDHVNMSQSSNDTFPTALHIAAVTALYERLFPVWSGWSRRTPASSRPAGPICRTPCPSPSGRRSAAGAPWSSTGGT